MLFNVDLLKVARGQIRRNWDEGRLDNFEMIA